MKVTKADLRLYAITDRQWLGGKDFYMVVEQVLKNGATFLQLREKNATHEQRVEEAKKSNRLRQNIMCRLLSMTISGRQRKPVRTVCISDRVIWIMSRHVRYWDRIRLSA